MELNGLFWMQPPTARLNLQTGRDGEKNKVKVFFGERVRLDEKIMMFVVSIACLV